MTECSLNCLPEAETITDLVRSNCAIGFDLRFCRSVAVTTEDRDTITCDPGDAEFATLYALTDPGEAIAIHDVTLSSAGAPSPTASLGGISSPRRYRSNSSSRQLWGAIAESGVWMV